MALTEYVSMPTAGSIKALSMNWVRKY